MRAFRSFALGLLVAGFAMVSVGVADASEIRIAGRVLDEVGQPVAGGSAELQRLHGGLFERPVASAPVRDGRFEIAAPGPGMWRLIVRSPSRVPAMTTLAPLLFPVVLTPVYLPSDVGAELELRDTAGAAVVEAEVRAVPAAAGDWPRRNSSYAPTWRPAPRSGRTDEQGRLRLARVEGETLDFSALAAGFDFQAVRGVEGWRVVLEAAGEERSLRFVERLSQQDEPRPVAGATLLVEPGEWRLGPSDGDGRLPFFAAGGPVRAWALFPDGRRQRVELDDPGAASSTLETIELLPQRRIAGRVEDARGMPVEGAFVMRPELARQAARTGEDGVFTLYAEPGEELGDIRLFVAAPGYLPRRAIFEARDGPAEMGVIGLRPASAVAGRVLDAYDQPQADVSLDVFDRRTTSELAPSLAAPSFTDAEGRFYLGALEPRRAIDVALGREDLRRLDVVFEPLEDFELRRGVELRMDTAPLLVGRVVDVEGHAVAGARVELDGSLLRIDGEVMPARLGGDDDVLELTTGDDGSFAATLTTDGLLDIEVAKEGYARLRLEGLAVSGDGGRFELEEIRLERSSPLRGRVVERGEAAGEDGRPVEGAEIYLFSRAFDRFDEVDLHLRFRRPEARSGPDGRFSVDGLHPGAEADLIVRREGYARSVVPGVTAPDEQILVRLEKAFRLAGKVVDEGGEGIARAEVFLRRPFALDPSTRAKVRSESDGSFLLDDVPAGEVELQARSAGFALGRLALEVTADRDDLRLELPSGYRVSGTVVDPSGMPIQGAAVRLLRPPEVEARLEPSRLVNTGATGRFEHEGVGGGEWRLEVSRDWFDVEKRITVEADLELEVVLDGPGEPLSGLVIDEGGRGIEGVRVQLVGEDGGEGPSAVSQVGGAFRFPRVEAGTWRVRTAFSPRQVAVPVSLVADPGSVIVDGDENTPEPEIELIVGEGAMVRGRVTGLAPSELPRVEITAVGERAVYRRQRIPVGAGGGYEVDRLAVGRWRLVAALPGTGRRAAGEVEILPGQREARLDLDFAAGYRLAGRVVADGEPLAGVTVVVGAGKLGTGGLEERTRTDRAGRFEVSGLGAGPLRVVVELEGPSVVRELELRGDTELVIDLLE